MSSSRKKRGYLLINGRKNPVFEGVNPIGRQRQSTVILLDHTVSHQQAMVIIIKENHYLCDLNSCNGTSIDQFRLKPLELHEITDKQKLCFGNVKAAYEILVPGEDVSQDHQLSQINDDIFSLQTQRFDMPAGSQNTVDSRAIGDHLQFDDCVTLKSTETNASQTMENLHNISNAEDMDGSLAQNSITMDSKMKNSSPEQSLNDMPTQIVHYDEGPSCSYSNFSNGNLGNSIYDMPTQIDDPDLDFQDLKVNKSSKQHVEDSKIYKLDVQEILINNVPTQIVTNADKATIASNKQSIHNLPTQLSNTIPSLFNKSNQDQSTINELPTQIVARSDQGTTSTKQLIHNLPTQLSDSMPSSPTKSKQDPPSINKLSTQIGSPKQLSSIHTLPTQVNGPPEAEKPNLLNELPTQVVSPCDDTQVLESDLETTNIDDQSALVEDTVVNNTVYNQTVDHDEDSNDSIDFMTMLPTTQVFESQGMLQVSHLTRKVRNVIGSDDDNSHKSSIDDVNMPCSLQTSLLKRKVKNIITSDEERKTQSTQSDETDVDDIPASQATQDNLKTSLLKRKVRNLIVSDDDMKIRKKTEELSDETDIEVVPKKVIDSSSSEDNTPLSSRKKKLRKKASPVLKKYNSDSETDVENPSPTSKIRHPNTKLTDVQNNPSKSNSEDEKSESTLVPAVSIDNDQAKPPTQINDDNTDIEDHIANDMNDSDLIPNTQVCFSGMKSIISQGLTVNKRTQDLTNFTEESIDGSLNLMLTESMDVTKCPSEGSQNDKTKGSTSQNGTKDSGESQKNVEVVSSDLSISSSSKDTIIDNTTGHHLLINKNNGTDVEDEIFLKPTQCIQEFSNSKENNIYYEDVFDNGTQVEPSPKRNNNQEAENDQYLLDEDDDIFMKATQCIKDPPTSNLNDDTNPSKSPVLSYSSPKSRLKIDLQVTATSVGDLSNNPDFQDDIFMQATQATDFDNSVSKSLLIAERNPVDDDIFLQATQQLPMESNTADDDVFLQATQPVASTSSSPFEFKKPALNSPFETKRHNIRVRYDLLNKTPDDRCHDNVEENLKNMFLSQPVGDDDVFLQPTQEVQNKVDDDIFNQPTQPNIFLQSTQEVKNKVDDDIFNQPTQPNIFLQSTQEVKNNDDDIFNQPTQQAVCFPRMSTQPSIESQMELVFGGQITSPIFPRCDGRPQNPLANILETLQSQHEIIIPSDDVTDAATIIDEEKVKLKLKKNDDGKNDKKILMKKEAMYLDEESGQIADTLHRNNDEEESGNVDHELSRDCSPEVTEFAKSSSPIPGVKTSAEREKSSRRKVTLPPLEVDQTGTGNNINDAEKKKNSRSCDRNTPSPETILLAKPKRNTPSPSALISTKADNLHLKPPKKAHVTSVKEETKDQPSKSKAQNPKKNLEEEPSVAMQVLETRENDDKEIQRKSPLPDMSLSPRSRHSTTSSLNKEALSTIPVPKAKKYKSAKGKHPTDQNEVLEWTSSKKAGLPDSQKQSAKSTDIRDLDSCSPEPTSKPGRDRSRTGSEARPSKSGRPKRSHRKHESASPHEQMGNSGMSEATNETREMSPESTEQPDRLPGTDIQDICSALPSKKTRGRPRLGRATSPEEKSKPKRSFRKQESTSPVSQMGKSGAKEASKETTANALPGKSTDDPSTPSGDVETIPARRSKRKPSVPSPSPQRHLAKTESRVDVKERTSKQLFVETTAKQMPGRSTEHPIRPSGDAKKTDIRDLESGSPELKRSRGRFRAVREASQEEKSKPKRSLRKEKSTSPEAQVGKSRTRDASNETTAKEMPEKLTEDSNSPSGDVETVPARKKKRKPSAPSTSPLLHLAKTESRVDVTVTTSKQLSTKSAEVPVSPPRDITPARRSKRKSSMDKFVILKKHRIDDELSLIEEVPESSTAVDLTHSDSVEEVNTKKTRGRKASQSMVRSVVTSFPSTSKSEEDNSVTTGKRGRQNHRRQSATSEDDFVVKPTRKRTRLDMSTKDPSQSSNMSDSILSSSGMPETPERAKRKLKPKVVFTMMDSPELESLIRRLGGSVVDSVDQCTVLVTCNVKRSQKLLSAVGQGKPVCSSSWLDGCRKANKFLDPWDHIILDAEAEKKWNFSLKESLNRSSQKKLLEKYTVLVLVSAAQDVLKGAIESCGGKCVLRAPGKYTGELVVVSSEEIKSKHAKYLKSNPKPFIVVPEAIFDGVLRQELNFEKYKLA